MKATEYCLLNRFSFKVFLPAELFIIYPIHIWSRLRSLVIISTEKFQNIIINECELKNAYQKNFVTEKNGSCFFYQSASTELPYQCMASEEELSCEDHVWSFDNIILHVQKRTMKNRFLQLERNFYSMRLLKIIVKTVIYVICDKYKFMCSCSLIATRFLNLIINLKN